VFQLQLQAQTPKLVTLYGILLTYRVSVVCLCGSGTDSKVSLAIIQVHAVTNITDISRKHSFNTQHTGEITRICQSSQDGADLCLKCTKIRLAAWLYPDLLGEIKGSPDSLQPQ